MQTDAYSPSRSAANCAMPAIDARPLAILRGHSRRDTAIPAYPVQPICRRFPLRPEHHYLPICLPSLRQAPRRHSPPCPSPNSRATKQIMNAHPFTLAAEPLFALPSGALFQPSLGLLCASDLHLGKSDRIARRSGTMLPPYETRATLDRLAQAIDQTGARIILCLGDSFDDLDAADSLSPDDRATLLRLQAGRRWIWLEGNHDPGPIDLGGTHLSEFTAGPLTYRHIAQPGAVFEVSGHYHPKINLPGIGARACFLFDDTRLMLPAFGTYTGGLPATDPAIRSLFAGNARAILTGRRPILTALPRQD